MKANYENSDLVQENKHRAKMYEELSKNKEVENAEEWTPVESGTEINSGMTKYDMAKQGAVAAAPLSPGALSAMRKEIGEFAERHPDIYYMMLCHEQRDYTVFHTQYGGGWQQAVAATIQECLENRGSIVGYEIQEETGGIELWIKDIDANEAYAYYFFPYGPAIVEV